MPTVPVFVLGSCPGIGKTTLAEALVANLRTEGLAVAWFPEEAVLEHPAFATVADTFRKTGGVVPGELLAASEVFARSWSTCEDDVLIIDALFPFVTSLLASGYSERETDAFVRSLWDIVRPAQPLTIYVDGDARVALRRAHEGRGEAWMSDWTARVRRWNIDPPLRDVAAIARHFERERAFTLRLLEDLGWTYTRIDAASETPDAMRDRALGVIHAALATADRATDVS